MPNQRASIPLLLGPTASGKSRMALQWAEANGAAIVCLDSRTVFRGLDIGTAKATREEQRRVPHTLLDVAEVGSPVSAARLAQMAEQYIASLQSKEIPCIVVGGSTLHLTALVYGLSPIPAPDREVRERLNDRLHCEGLDSLVVDLKSVDAITANRIDLDNPARVVRALEVYLSTSKPLSHWHTVPRTPPHFSYAIVGLKSRTDWLSARIAQRADAMVSSGLLDETAEFAHCGESLRAVIGYREALDVLSGDLPRSHLSERIAIATRQYARRQRRYFGKTFPDAVMLNAASTPGIRQLNAAIAEARARRAQRSTLHST